MCYITKPKSSLTGFLNMPLFSLLPQSSDLSPIAPLWDVLEWEIHIMNVQQQCYAVMSIWLKIDEECLKHLLESMPPLRHFLKMGHISVCKVPLDVSRLQIAINEILFPYLSQFKCIMLGTVAVYIGCPHLFSLEESIKLYERSQIPVSDSEKLTSV